MTSCVAILITSHELIRFDFSSSNPGASARIQKLARLDSDATLVDFRNVLKLGGCRRKKVWVASVESWFGEVSLDKETVFAAGEDGLEQTIALESEDYSTIPAFSSRVAFKRIGQSNREERFAVAQISESMFRGFADAVRNNCGALAGVGTPFLTDDGSLDRIYQSPSQPSAIVQEWDGNILSVGMTPAGRTWQWHSGTCDNKQTRERVNEALIESGVPSTTRTYLSESRNATMQGGDELQIGLSGDDYLRSWLDNWARSDLGRSSSNLVITPKKEPISATAWTASSVVFAAIVGLLCSVFYTLSPRALDAMKVQIARLQEDKKTLDELKKQITASEKELTEATSKLATDRDLLLQLQRNTKQAERGMELRQERWLALIQALPREIAAQCTIESITPKSDGTVIEGYSLTSMAANQSAKALSNALANSDWIVHPAEVEFTDRGLYRFQIELAIGKKAKASSEGVLTKAEANKKPHTEKN